MHHFTVGSAAPAVLVDRRIDGLVFRLTRRAVHGDVIALHVATAFVIDEFNADGAGVVGGGAVIRHAGGERPCIDGGPAHGQPDLFGARRALGPDDDRVRAAAAGRTG